MLSRLRNLSVESGPCHPNPGVDDAPISTFWSESDFGRDWRPPACTSWAGAGFSTLVTVARFCYTSGTEGLLRRIGAISELAGMRYWSTTHKQWQTLIVEANALANPKPSHHRQDFTPDEMTEGKLLYLEQVDNLSGTAVYRLHIAEASADGSSSKSRMSARCVISWRHSSIRVRCSRSIFSTANPPASGGITVSYAPDATRARWPPDTRLPRPTGPLPSIVPWPVFPPTRNLRQFDSMKPGSALHRPNQREYCSGFQGLRGPPAPASAATRCFRGSATYPQPPSHIEGAALA